MPNWFLKIFALFVILTGVVGFFPNAAVGVDGFFVSGWGNNTLFILTGLMVWFFSRSEKFFVVANLLSVFYIGFAILGFLYGNGKVLNLFFLHPRLNWFHLVFGILIFSLNKKKSS